MALAKQREATKSVAYFPGKTPESISVVCPKCSGSFAVAVAVVRRAKNLACTHCGHVRPSPALPSALANGYSSPAVSEFP